MATNPLQPMGALSLTIYSDGTQAYPAAQQIAWGTAFVLLTLVLVLSVVARVVSARLNRRAR
jgi:ABC-type phosphate transport system permease subunit